MHPFSELIQYCTSFTLGALRSAQDDAIEQLQTSAATPLVKTLQVLQLQKAISAIGMFSMFEATLQSKLKADDGFRAAGELLDAHGAVDLKEQFTDLQLAVNALKHGRGRSYEALVKKANSLPFRVKLPNEAFFNEGDVSEICTLVEVDDAFVQRCADLIHEVSVVIRAARTPA
jgi:hypothetical protein